MDDDTGETRVVAMNGVSINVELPLGEPFDRIVAHEFSHHHDYEVRRANGVTMRSDASCMMWTEYFAERMRWRAGFRHLALIGPQPVPNGVPPAEPAEPLDGYVRAYMDAQFLALIDEDPGLLKRQTPTTRALITSDFAVALRTLFAAFPLWTSNGNELDILAREGRAVVMR